MSFLVFFLVLLSVVLCGISPLPPLSALSSLPIGSPDGVPLNSIQWTAIQQMTSVFENGTPDIQYSYCEALGDGRGITAGAAGFTSGTGDLVLVVQLILNTTQHTHPTWRNPLKPYLPILISYASSGSGSLIGLANFCSAWLSVSQWDFRIFQSAQNEISDALYGLPSINMAMSLGLRLPLSYGQLFDSFIQHGSGSDLDSVNSLIFRTQTIINLKGGGNSQKFNSTNPMGKSAEIQWISTFLTVRFLDLDFSSDENSREVWRESVDRVTAYRRIAEKGNWELHTPIPLFVFGGNYNITGEQNEDGTMKH